MDGRGPAGLGLIEVYTGNGKGKTTAALGLALRAWGHGLKVLMVQFMKGSPQYGEVKAAAHLAGFSIIQVGRDEFVDLKNPAQVDIDLARTGWAMACRAIDSGDYDIVILDEINVAMACGLLDAGEVVAYLSEKRRPVEIVLTGRYAPEAVLAAADLVTEMKENRHPFAAGIPAREGIDF